MLCPACGAVSTGAGRCGACGAAMPLPGEDRVLEFPVTVAVPLDRRGPRDGGPRAVAPGALARDLFLDRREEPRLPEPSALGRIRPVTEAAAHLIRHAVTTAPLVNASAPREVVEVADEDGGVEDPLECEVDGEIVLPPAPPVSRRLMAWGIDGTLVIAPLLAALAAATHGATGEDGVPLGLLGLLAGSGPVRAAAVALAAVIAFVYLTLSSAVGGRTPGAVLAGLEVVTCADGAPPTLGRAALRAALAVAGCLAFFAGPISALLDGRGRALHDKLAGTVVMADR